MAFTRIVSVSRAGNGATGAIDTTGCDLLIYGTSSATGDPGMVSDSQGNIWTPLGYRNGSGVGAKMFFCLHPTTNASHTFTCPAGFSSHFVVGYSIAAGKRVVRDAQADAAGSGSTLTVGPITPRGTNRLVVAVISHQQATAPTAASLTNVETRPNTGGVCTGGVLAEEIQTTAVTRSAAWSIPSGGQTAGEIAAFVEIDDTVPLFSTNAKSGTGANSATTAALDSTGAGLIVVSAHASTGSSATLTDSKGNTWTALTSYSTTNTRTRLFYCASPIVGSGHTFNALGTSVSMTVTGWSGTWAFDVENGAGSSTTDRACGSVTPAANLSLVVAAVTSTLGEIAQITTDQMVSLEYSLNTAFAAVAGTMAFEIQAVAAAVNPTFEWAEATSLETSGAVAVFNPSSPPAATLPNFIHHYRQQGIM